MTLFADFYHHDLSPFLIRFGDSNWGIRYYGLAYAFGFLAFWLGLHWQTKRGWCQLRPDKINDLVTWVSLVGVLVGGRLGYCLFYDWQRTLADPLHVVRVWEGGMASHGGILGVIAVLWVYARSQRIPFYNLADATALCAPVGICLGRIANFINGELWGHPTTVPWAVYFPEADALTGISAPRHPSQLYEAFLEGLVLGGLLLWTRYKTRKDGVVALTFIGAYAVLRFIGECFREPDVQIGYYLGWMSQGQLFSIALLALALALAWMLKSKPQTQDK